MIPIQPHTCRADVERVNREHPDWSSKEIAAELDASYAYVRSTVSRAKLTVPSFFARRKIVGPLMVKT